MKLSQKILKFFICFFLAITLAGCFRGEILLDIRPNGSAILSGSFGLNSQAKMLLSMQNIDLKEQLPKIIPGDGSLRTSSWIDGEYEWVKYERDLKDFDEVNNTLNQGNIFNQFSLTRKKALFKNQYVLDAEMDFSTSDGTTTDLTGMSASSMIDFRFLARMPGTIQENNGLTDINDPSLVVWPIDISGINSIYAKSYTWNYLDIGILGVGIILIAILITSRIHAQKSKKQKNSVIIPSSDMDTSVNCFAESDTDSSNPADSTNGEHS